MSVGRESLEAKSVFDVLICALEWMKWLLLIAHMPPMIQLNWWCLNMTLIPGTSHPPFFDGLQYSKMEGEGLGTFIT